MNERQKRVFDTARSWVGQWFKAGLSAQCANFVRHVYTEANLTLPVAARPIDWEQTRNLPQGPSLANSFAGNEVGLRVAIGKAQPGDIVMFARTYGQFGPNVITHVGIYAGDAMMIDRPTMDQPVQHRSLSQYWQERLVDVRRPHVLLDDPDEVLEEDPNHQVVKVFARRNAWQAFVDGKPVEELEVQVWVKPGKCRVKVAGDLWEVDPASLEIVLKR